MKKRIHKRAGKAGETDMISKTIEDMAKIPGSPYYVKPTAPTATETPKDAPPTKQPAAASPPTPPKNTGVLADIPGSEEWLATHGLLRSAPVDPNAKRNAHIAEQIRQQQQHRDNYNYRH